MTAPWDARSFAERMDDETLLYAAQKVAEIRPEASLNREAGTAEAANADAGRAPSASSSPSGAEPRADAHCDVCGGRGSVAATPGQPGDGPERCERCGGTGSAGVGGDPSRVWGVDDPR